MVLSAAPSGGARPNLDKSQSDLWYESLVVGWSMDCSTTWWELPDDFRCQVRKNAVACSMQAFGLELSVPDPIFTCAHACLGFYLNTQPKNILTASH